MPVEITVSEVDIEILMCECHCTRDEAVRILTDIERTKMQYSAYLDGPFDPRD